jgi:hypothetical protein
VGDVERPTDRDVAAAVTAAAALARLVAAWRRWVDAHAAMVAAARDWERALRAEADEEPIGADHE